MERRSLRWDQIFKQRKPGVFEVVGEHWSLIDAPRVKDLAAASVDKGRIMAGGIQTFAILDGGLVLSEQTDPDEWDDDAIDDGVWVIGYEALRGVCDVTGVALPCPLPGEPSSPSARGRAHEARRQAELLTTWSGVEEVLRRTAP